MRTSFFKSRPYQVACWLLFVLWFVSLNLLSSLPGNTFPSGFSFPHLDKVVHFLLFAMGGLFLATAWTSSRPGLPLSRFFIIAILLALIGVADELRQLLIPGRSGADLGDMIANGIGAFAGSFFSYLCHVRFLSFRIHS